MKDKFRERVSYKAVTQQIASKLDTQGFMYKKNMCEKSCKFYKDETCIKKRSPIMCAKKGMKNRE